MASIDYYEDESTWGNYQYTLLEDVINDYSMSRSSDDYTSDTPRHQILYQALKGLRELYFDVLQEIKGVSLELSPSLQVTLPPDFVSYVRISWLDSFGQLHPMAMDGKMSIARDYLQDVNYGLLFDEQGCVLIGSPVVVPSPVQMMEENPDPDNYHSFSSGSFQPNKDMSTFFANGKYIIDKSAGLIQFGSDVKGKIVVLEYISDGLFKGCEGRAENEIRVHKLAESALLNYIYYELIKNRRGVPANEKARARKECYNSRRIAKGRLNSIKKAELIQTFLGSSKWIK